MFLDNLSQLEAEADALAGLDQRRQPALAHHCGIAVAGDVEVGEYADNAILELLYQLVNKHTSQHIRLPEGAFDMLGMVHGVSVP